MHKVADAAFTYINGALTVASLFIPQLAVANLVKLGLGLVYKHLDWGGFLNAALSPDEARQLKKHVHSAFNKALLEMPKDSQELLRGYKGALLKETFDLENPDWTCETVERILNQVRKEREGFPSEQEYNNLTISFMEKLEYELAAQNNALYAKLNRGRINEIKKQIDTLIAQQERTNEDMDINRQFLTDILNRLGVASEKEPLPFGEALFDFEQVEGKEGFVGRSKELQELCRLFDSYKMVVMTGIGGLGKSGLANQFAASGRFSHVQIIQIIKTSKTSSSLLETVVNGTQYNLAFRARFYGLSANSYYDVKLAALKTLDQETLFIVDNADNVNVRELRALNKLPMSFLITTRKSFSDFHEKAATAMSLGKMEPEDLRLLFEENYGRELSDSERTQFFTLVGNIGFHTLTTELIAGVMRCQNRTFDEMISLSDRLDVDSGKVYYSGDRSDHDNDLETVYAHLHAIFDLTALSEQEKRILGCLSLIHPKGISEDSLKSWLGLTNDNELLSLHSSNWIDRSDGIVSTHPLLSRIFFKDTPPSQSDREVIADKIAELMKFDECENYTELKEKIQFGEFTRGRLCELGNESAYESLLYALADGYIKQGEHEKSEILMKILEGDKKPSLYKVKTVFLMADLRFIQFNFSAAIKHFEYIYANRKPYKMLNKEVYHVLNNLCVCYRVTNNAKELERVMKLRTNAALAAGNTIDAVLSFNEQLLKTKTPQHEKKRVLKRLRMLSLEKQDLMGVIGYLSGLCIIRHGPRIRFSNTTVEGFAEYLNYMGYNVQRGLGGYFTYKKTLRFIKELKGQPRELLTNLLFSEEDGNFTGYFVELLECIVENMLDSGQYFDAIQCVSNTIELCRKTDIDLEVEQLWGVIEKYNRKYFLITNRIPVISPHYIRRVVSCASLYCFAGNFIAAINFLEIFLKKLEGIPDGNKFMLCDIYEKLGDLYSHVNYATEKAEEAYNKCLKIKKDYGADKQELARIYLLLGDLVSESKEEHYYVQCCNQLEKNYNCTRCEACLKLAKHYYLEYDDNEAKKYHRKMVVTKRKNKLCTPQCSAVRWLDWKRIKHERKPEKPNGKFLSGLLGVLHRERLPGYGQSAKRRIGKGKIDRLNRKKYSRCGIQGRQTILLSYLKDHDFSPLLKQYAFDIAARALKKPKYIKDHYFLKAAGERPTKPRIADECRKMIQPLLDEDGRLLSEIQVLALLNSERGRDILERSSSPNRAVTQLTWAAFDMLLYGGSSVGIFNRPGLIEPLVR